MFTKILNSIKSAQTKFISQISKKPFLSLSVAVFTLVVCLIVGNKLYKPIVADEDKTPVKTVSVYHVGKAPRLNFQAKVEKKNVVTIVAQTSGIVQDVYRTEGQNIERGSWLVGLSTNYQGGNVASLQRQMAAKQYETLNNTYSTQKEIISKQREIAKKTDYNSDELREISKQALSNINDQISLDKSILDTLENNINTLEKAADTEANRTLILTTKQYKSQYLSAIGQLESSVRSIDYSTNDDKYPAKLSNLAREITLKQLDLQEKSLDLNKEVGLLSLRISQISESLMYPSVPFTGTIEKVYVKVGQKVDSGTSLALLSGAVDKTVATVYVPEVTAKAISKLEESTFTIGNKQVSLAPSYISNEATDGQMYSVTYNLPSDYDNDLTDGEYISVSIPVGYADTGSVMPFVPLDVISQTQDETTLYVVVNNKVEYKNVKLGNVFGRFVEVKEGLNEGDIVILNRNIVVGDVVNFQ